MCVSKALDVKRVMFRESQHRRVLGYDSEEVYVDFTDIGSTARPEVMPIFGTPYTFSNSN
jgi:hypothetical protein